MKALLCEAYGPPENLRLRDIPIPVPGPGELLVRMHAVGLNFPESLIISDKYQIRPALPFAPGGELAGVVEQVGPGVDMFRRGDRVAALTTYGAFADYVVTQAYRTTSIPDAVDFETAGAFTFVYGTAYYALSHRADLKPRETVLVLGAAGGVGLACVQVAKAMGARVIAAASSAEKLAVAAANGADDLLNYAEQDLKNTVKDLTGGKGVDVIFDPVGSRFAEPAFRTMAWEGRYLVVGFAGGDIPAMPMQLPLVKGASIIGIFWGEAVKRAPQVHQQDMEKLFAMVVEGKLKPLISARYGLRQGAQAIRHIMDRKAIGKVVVLAED